METRENANHEALEASARKQHPRFREFADAFHRVFKAKHGEGPKWGDRERSVLDKHLKDMPQDSRVQDFTRRAVTMLNWGPRFPCETGADIWTLCRHWDRFAAGDETQGPYRNSQSRRGESEDANPFGSWEDNLK